MATLTLATVEPCGRKIGSSGSCGKEVCARSDSFTTTVGSYTPSCTPSPSVYGNSSEGSSANPRQHVVASVVAWDQIYLGAKIQPFAKYAHCTEDLHLLSTFLALAQPPELHGDGIKTLLRAVRMLRLCDYCAEDICSVLAHASAYFKDVHAVCGGKMDSNEVAMVLVCLIYIAHSWVQDETCPLHVWHKHLFRKYCTVRMLNSAVMRLLEIRNHKLRLSTAELRERYECLCKELKQQKHQQAAISLHDGSDEAN
mmetsp:Transcript_76182/g.218278  ORF Transcript_76182/g.218278 Transcript_76182/m.218278 type:complete len:255 (+) Transcript_76182:80-844(+)